MTYKFDTYEPQATEALLDGNTAQTGSVNPIRKSIRRMEANTDVAAALTTQVMTSVAIALHAGDIVTSIGVQFGATAADTPTNWFFALYDTSSTPAKLGQTADQTTGAIAANAFKNVALSAPVAITKTGIYYVGVMVKATTVPSVICKVLPTAASAGAQVTGQKILAQTSGSSLTATAPSTITSATTVVNVPLVVVS